MTNERIKKSGQLLNKIYYVIKTYRSAQQFTTQTVQLTLKCIESKTFPRSSHSVRSKSPTHQSLPILRVNFPTVTLTANATMVSRQFLKRKATATMLDCKQSRARPSRDQFGCINRFSFAFIVCARQILLNALLLHGWCRNTSCCNSFQRSLPYFGKPITADPHLFMVMIFCWTGDARNLVKSL